MARAARADQQRRSDQLHPVIYKIMVALAVLLIAAAWSFTGHGGYAPLLLTVVTLFFIVALTIPYDLWRISQRNHRPDVPGENDVARPGPAGTYRDWASGEFFIWQDRVKGRSAAIEALLPIAAVAIGMVAFAIVLHFVV